MFWLVLKSLNFIVYRNILIIRAHFSDHNTPRILNLRVKDSSTNVPELIVYFRVILSFRF